MSPKLLLVYVAGKTSGWLGYEDGMYRFHYSSSRADQTPVSRLMPCSRTFYESPSLFPVFAQHLPVGVNREWLVSHLNIRHLNDGAQNMSLLAASGYNGIGNCGFVNADAPSLKPRYTVNPRLLLQASDSRAVFMDWRNKYGEQGMGVGGNGSEDNNLCLLLNTKPAWPVPNVVAVLGGTENSIQKKVQHLSLVKEAGVLCPTFELSNDGRVLVLERHDLNAKGQRMPVEGLARLCGLSCTLTSGPSGLLPAIKPLPLEAEYLVAERVLKVFSARFVHDLKMLKKLQQLPSVRPLRDLCYVGDQLAVTVI
ncbi:MAG: HipA N-terminal domain-containing protein [Limnobacter sp.]|nr:HipA N-terminal domain-containing protein [Limnobacter sp.]